MRRRSIIAARSAGAAEVPVDEPAKEIPKGVCRFCQKYIGRGLHFHEKKCGGMNGV